MHDEKFFILWLDDQNKMGAEDVTGLSGLNAKLWLLYDDDHVNFSSIHISVIPNK